jgi:hypothetical protein
MSDDGFVELEVTRCVIELGDDGGLHGDSLN